MENIIAGLLAVTGLAEIYVLIYLIATPRKGKNKSFVLGLEKLNIFLALFFAITLGAFFFLNGPAYAENLTFDIKSFFGDNTNVVTDEPIFNLPNASAATNGSAMPNVTVLPKGTAMELVISKTGVRTPIVFPTDVSTKGVLKALEGGVGAYPGSVMPGQKGHMILLGHSSLASWYHGNYARVFALLNRLAVGDEFVIVADNMKYVYKISSNQVLKPAAADAYLALPVEGSIVDLVTCDPVGSAANRRIVSAELIAGGQ
jgi:LPXTG-site transpeptidase (sortase) family protein